MKRATLHLDDEVYEKAKRLSREKGISLREVVNDLMIRGLQSLRPPKKGQQFTLPLREKLQPRDNVDISDRHQIYDLLDEDTD